jgi:ribosomal protein S18 acetylase RimI-like enzyme
MPDTQIETATLNDLPALCRLRAEYEGHALEWEPRITAYMIGQQNPQFALEPREVFVAVEDATDVVGVISGHLTTRFHCQGEIQWLNVQADHRGRRIADKLLDAQFAWFRSHNARKICISVAPSNDACRTVLQRRGAVRLGEQWLIFEDIGA